MQAFKTFATKMAQRQCLQLQEKYTKSGMSRMQQSVEPYSHANSVLKKYFDYRRKRDKIYLQQITKDNCYLTQDEKITIISIVNLMASMAIGITKIACLKFKSSLIQTRVE